MGTAELGPTMALLKCIYYIGSQNQLAKKLNVKQPTITYWLKTKVPVPRVFELLEACDNIVTKEQLRPDIFR